MRSLLSPVCLPVPGYAIDDQTAIKVTDGAVEVVSEGHWKLFTQE
jgi:dipeptidase E